MVTVKIIIIRREEEEEEEETLIQNMTKSYKMLSFLTHVFSFIYLFVYSIYLFIYLCNHEVMVNDSDILGTALSNVNIDTT